MQHLGGNEHSVALALWQEARAPFRNLTLQLSRSQGYVSGSQGAFVARTLTENSILVLADHQGRKERVTNSSGDAEHLPKDTTLGQSDWRQARDTERKRNARLALSRPGTSEVPKPTPLLFKTLGARPALSRRHLLAERRLGALPRAGGVPGPRPLWPSLHAPLTAGISREAASPSHAAPPSGDSKDSPAAGGLHLSRRPPGARGRRGRKETIAEAWEFTCRSAALADGPTHQPPQVNVSSWHG